MMAMISMKCICFLLVGAVLVSEGCSSPVHVDSLSSYLKWLNDEANGLVKIKYVNGMEMKVKYLPAEYLANNEFRHSGEYSQALKDSILNTYKNSVCFMLTLAPDEREKKGENVMTRSVKNYKEYAERVNDMNFKIEEFVKLKVGTKEYRPVLSSLENVYELNTGRNIMLVFVPDGLDKSTLLKADKFDFEYADELFELGTNHFVFAGIDIQKIPAFTFWNKD
jgi:hypothetical protein